MDARNFFSSGSRNLRSNNRTAYQKDTPQLTPPSYGPGDVLQSGTRVPISEQDDGLGFEGPLFDDHPFSIEHLVDTPTSRPPGDRPRARAPHTSRITLLLQEQQLTLANQQAVLQTLLENQQKQSAELDVFKRKLSTFEHQLSEQSSSLSEAPTPKRIKISRALLVGSSMHVCY